MLTEQTFTDPQGQKFTDAVVRVVSATRSYGQSTNGDVVVTLPPNYANDLEVDENQHSNTFDEIRVQYGYWPTRQAFDENRYYYRLTDPSANNQSRNFEFRIPETFIKTRPETATTAELCMAYYNEVIKPELS